MKPQDLLYEDQLPGGTHWSLTIPRGRALRLVDIEGGGNVAMLFYNPRNLLERYNAPDTLKCQHIFRITQGACLYSDMARIFCSVIEDSAGWHDTVCGTLGEAETTARWGRLRYGDARNDRIQNGYDSFLIEAAKYGMGQRDLGANINWFSKVTSDVEGRLSFDATQLPPGRSVTLRFEMDTLVLLHTCPHPLNLAPIYPRKPILYQLLRADPVADDDPCRNACPENIRGFINNNLYHLGG
jgi:urea carboxylase-associated protein 2